MQCFACAAAVVYGLLSPCFLSFDTRYVIGSWPVEEKSKLTVDHDDIYLMMVLTVSIVGSADVDPTRRKKQTWRSHPAVSWCAREGISDTCRYLFGVIACYVVDLQRSRYGAVRYI